MTAAVISPIDDNGCVLFRCPGCGFAHAPWIRDGSPVKWEWNGSFDKPVLSPSLLYTRGNEYRCHSFIGCNGAQPGQIIFLQDCTHALAGQTVDLPPWER